MRNIFQAISYVEATIVRNMLVAHGIDAIVNRPSASRAGIVCAEVWIHEDVDGERATALIHDFLAKQSDEYEYRGSRSIAIVLRLVGVASIILGFVHFLEGVFPGERVATSLTFIALGVFLYAQGNAERRKVQLRTPSPKTAPRTAAMRGSVQ